MHPQGSANHHVSGSKNKGSSAAPTMCVRGQGSALPGNTAFSTRSQPYLASVRSEAASWTTPSDSATSCMGLGAGGRGGSSDTCMCSSLVPRQAGILSPE